MWAFSIVGILATWQLVEEFFPIQSIVGHNALLVSCPLGIKENLVIEDPFNIDNPHVLNDYPF
jgi:hypothetical protein